MLTYKGAYKAEAGTYWDMETGYRVDVGAEAVLPGNSASTYIKSSPVVMALAGPILGLLYVVLLPFIGIAATVFLAGGKLLKSMFCTTGKSISFGWRPGRAYLSGKKKKQ